MSGWKIPDYGLGTKSKKSGKQERDPISKGMTALSKDPAKWGIMAVVIFICYLVIKNNALIAEAFHLEGPGRLAVFGVLLLPFLFLAAWSNDPSAKNMDEIFEEIGFKNSNGAYPKLIRKYKDPNDKRVQRYEFNSPGITLMEWRNRSESIGNAFNGIVRNIEESPDNKQIMVMDMIPPQYKLPVSTREHPFWWDEKLAEKYENKPSVILVGQGLLDPVKIDLDKDPHILAAGQTGSGKSVVIQCILWQLVKKGAVPIVVDFKGGIEFGGVWKNFCKVVIDIDDALEMFQKISAEDEARFRYFAEDGEKYDYDCKNLTAYNKKHPDDQLSRIIVVIDEAADLLSVEGVADKEEKAKKMEIGHLVMKLATKSRAAGIHMIFGMQRPDAKTMNGQIRNNITSKICGKCNSGDGQYLSEMVLGTNIATTIGKSTEGRFYGEFGNGLEQFQSYYFEPKKFVVPGTYRNGRTLVLEEETPLKDDPEQYNEVEAPDEEPAESDVIEGVDWNAFGKI